MKVFDDKWGVATTARCDGVNGSVSMLCSCLVSNTVVETSTRMGQFQKVNSVTSRRYWDDAFCSVFDVRHCVRTLCHTHTRSRIADEQFCESGAYAYPSFRSDVPP